MNRSKSVVRKKFESEVDCRTLCFGKHLEGTMVDQRRQLPYILEAEESMRV